jgi:hypothetical protein
LAQNSGAAKSNLLLLRHQIDGVLGTRVAFHVFMEKMNFKATVASILLSSIIAVSAGAKPVHLGYLETAESAFKMIPNQGYGLEVEMTNMEMERAAEIIVARVGGVATRIDKKTIEILGTTIGNKLADKKGRILVKLEVNETSDDPNAKWDPASAIEIVSDPIVFEQEVKDYHDIIQDLKAGGAHGTFGPDGKINAVSIQVNYGMMEGTADERVTKALNIARNYLSPNHQDQAMENLEIPAVRKPYLKPYSKGLMKKLFTHGYNPTAKEFYFDFFYRQSLEFAMNGDQSAWTMSESEVRYRIKGLQYPVDVTVIKLNQIKIASLLLFLFPDDPYTKAVLKQGWIKKAPLIEFRNNNNDFDVMKVVRQTTGVVIMTEKLGVYDNDTEVERRYLLTPEEIWNSRKKNSSTWQNYKPGSAIMSCQRVLKK